MKFLQWCLCTCLAVGGVSQLHAQQTLTPEQQKQAIEALRKALDQPPAPVSAPAGIKVIPPAETLPASEIKPGEKSAAPTGQNAKAQADAQRKARAETEGKRLLEEEKRALEQQKRYEAKRQTELEAQAKRNADLRTQKETDAKSGAAAKRPAEPQIAPKTGIPIVVQTPAPPLTAAPITPGAPAAPATPPAPAPFLSNDQNSAAREALRRALDQAATPSVPVTAPQTVVQPAVKTPTPPPPPAPVVAVPAPAIAPVVIESKASAVVPVTPVLSQNQAEAARASLRRKLEEVEAATSTDNKRDVKTDGNQGTAPVLPRVPAVETTLPASKAQRLADLTQSYLRDQITPAEYHSRRAKILAEPN